MAVLMRTPFLEGWRSAAFQELRKAHLQGDVRATPCEQCVAVVKREQ